MFYNSSKIMFFTIMLMGTMITMSSNSWLSAWMGLEINLLAFIPLMSNSNNLMSTEASLKYFLIQALASIVLLFTILMILLKYNLQYSLTNNYNMMILSSLLMKMGAAPFHFWFPNLSEGLSWMNLLMLLTWQKLAPMSLAMLIPSSNLLIISVLLSALVGAMGGLNQTSLRKLMTYSSINHMSWMLMAMNMNNSIWLMYFFMYSFLSFILIFMFNMKNMSHVNQLFFFYSEMKNLKFIVFLNLLSMGGLPPFMGFLPKWLVIQCLMANNNLFIMFFMLMMSLIVLYFYLRLTYSAFMLNYYESQYIYMNWYKSKSMYMYLILSFISVFGLLMISLIYFMM